MYDVHHAVLACHQCAQETPHEIRYAGRLLVRTRCTACGYEVKTADLHRYLLDLRHRAVTKPRRMLRRLRRDPGEFVRTLPGAAATKPLKIVQEVATVLCAADERDARPPRARPGA